MLDFIKSYFLIDHKSGCRFLTVDANVKRRCPFTQRMVLSR